VRSSTFTLRDAEGVDLFVRKWEPDSGKPKAILQFEHGVAEHSGRHEGPAERLCAAGYVVYADDHRGHGLTAPATGGLGRLGAGGWDAVVRDLAMVSDRALADHPGLPLFLCGFSWGSHLAQDYAQRWGERLAGLVLIGSSGWQPPVITALGPVLSALLVALRGPNAPNKVTKALVFKPYNKRFEPSPTDSDSDWICRDPAVVRSFVKDPLCGFDFSNRMSLQMSLAYRRLWRSDSEARIPRNLPVLIMSGTDDSSNDGLKNLNPLVERYSSRLEDVTLKLYEGARHDILSETNKEEVRGDLIAWLDERLARAGDRGSRR